MCLPIDRMSESSSCPSSLCKKATAAANPFQLNANNGTSVCNVYSTTWSRQDDSRGKSKPSLWLKSSFGLSSSGDSPASSTESSQLRSSFGRKKSVSSASSGASATQSLHSSLESNGSSKPKSGRLAMMLASKGHTSTDVFSWLPGATPLAV